MAQGHFDLVELRVWEAILKVGTVVLELFGFDLIVHVLVDVSLAQDQLLEKGKIQNLVLWLLAENVHQISEMSVI